MYVDMFIALGAKDGQNDPQDFDRAAMVGTNVPFVFPNSQF